MSRLIGGNCNGCGNRQYDCVCPKKIFVCAKGHERTVKGSLYTSEIQGPPFCETCKDEWFSLTFPMTTKTDKENP